jgi:hypothetical protein
MADDREAKFLDALYFGAKDGGVFDRAMALLADQFDCASATVVDFDAVAPEMPSSLWTISFSNLIRRAD